MFHYHTNVKTFSWLSCILHSHQESGYGRLVWTHSIFKSLLHMTSLVCTEPGTLLKGMYRKKPWFEHAGYLSPSSIALVWENLIDPGRELLGHLITWEQNERWHSGDIAQAQLAGVSQCEREHLCGAWQRVGEGHKAIRKHTLPVQERTAASPIPVRSSICLPSGKI